MSYGTLFVLAAVVGAAAPSPVVTVAQVAGVVTDVVVGDRLVHVSHLDRGVRRVSAVGADGVVAAGPSVPVEAIAAGVCGDDVSFIVPGGLVSGRGEVLIAEPPLLGVADRDTLPFVPVCVRQTEPFLLVRDGAVVATLDGGGKPVSTSRIAFRHRARVWSGGGARAIKGERPYAGALSVYAPWLYRLDADLDGDDDVVLVHEAQVTIIRRNEGGQIAGPVITRDLAALCTLDADADVRVTPGPRSLTVTASVGALPERTVVATVVADGTTPLGVVRHRATVEGLATVVAVPDAGPPILARIDTSLVALSGVVLTGRVSVEVTGPETLATLPTVADVRAGRVDGALPTAEVDLDGDGERDLVDLGEPGRVVVWRGRGGRFPEATPAASVPRPDRVLAAPQLRRVIIVGRAGKGATPVAFVQLARAGVRR